MVAFFFLHKCVSNHFSAKKGKQAECYPMVDRLQIVAEIIRAEPSQERHECLKRPEENSHAYRNTKNETPHDNPADHRHSKAIHSQGQ
jgi:hypothetical protein